MMVGSAIMTNVRRISRYLDLKTEQEMVQKQGNKGQKCSENSPYVFFFVEHKIKSFSICDQDIGDQPIQAG